MKNILKPIFLYISLCLFFYSCNQKEDNVQPEKGELISNDSKDLQTDLEDIAKIVAKSLEDPAVRMAIKHEAEQKFDGDYDILYKNFADFKMADGSKFESKLFAANASGRTDESQRLLMKNIPLLNISVPVNIEKWDVNTFIPLVAVNVKISGVSTIKAFDSKGNVHMLDLNEIPSEPVIVIGLNERVNIDGSLKKIMDVKANNLQVESIHTIKPNGRTSWGEFSRWDLYQEHLNMFRWTNNAAFNYAENWAHGKPEVRLYIKALGSGADLWSGMWTDNRGNFNDATWYVCDAPMFIWNLTAFGSRAVVYYWVEEDAGTTTSSTVSSTWEGVTYSTTFTGKTEDYKIGHTVVSFDTKMPTLYSMGNFQFVTHQP